MRIGEIVLIVALVAGMFLVLAFGFGTKKSDSNVGDTALATSAGCDMAAVAGKECGGGACPDCGGGEPVLAAFVDFSQDGEYALAGATIENTSNTLSVFDADGNQIGLFNIDDRGTMVPSATQPDDNVIKSAYSGPPGDTYSKYKIYPASYNDDRTVTALLEIDHINGNISITATKDLGRKHSRSYMNTYGTTGVGLDGSGSSTK